MNSIKLACGLLAISMVAGCGDSGTTFTFPPREGDCVDLAGAPCPGALTPAEREIVLPEGMSDTTLVYVVSTISLPEATPDPDGEGPLRSQAAGFNADGLDSGSGSVDIDANCEEFNQDFVAVTDPNHLGVDNALQGLVGTIEGLLDAADCPGMTTDGCLDATLQAQIEEGSLLLLMEVSGVNDYTYDSSVMLQLHMGATVDGSPPAVDSSGAITPGQAFTSVMALGTPVPGDIFAGRLAARTDVLPLAINAGDFMLVLMITQTQVRFDILETGLDRGAIGGVVTVDAIVAAAAELMPGIEDTVRSVVESIADVDPSSDPAVCTAVSMGILFSAVPATLN